MFNNIFSGTFNEKMNAMPISKAAITLQRICLVLSLMSPAHSQTPTKITPSDSIAHKVLEVKNKAMIKPMIKAVAVTILVLSM